MRRSTLAALVAAALFPSMPDAAPAGRPVPEARASGAEVCRARRASAPASVAGPESRASSNIDVISYTIDATVDMAGRSLAAQCEVGIESLVPGMAAFSLDLVDLTVTSVMENGTVPVAFTQAAGELQITPATPLGLAEQRTYAIAYGGQPTSGLYFSNQNGGTAFTFTEPYDARHWFPCRDMPEDKADWYRGRITVPTTQLAASNGDLVSVVDNGNGTHTFTYFHDFPIATYLISVATSAYQTFTQTAPGGTPLEHFVYPSHFTEAQYDFGNVPAMIDFYETKYWPFPFPTYGMAIAPMGGAMEHQTMTTMDPRFISGNRWGEGIVAHELAHQWWGDLVTCRDFKNIWLNEGFATYFDALFTQDFYGEPPFRQQMGGNRFVYFLYEPFEGRFPTYDPSYLWGVTVYEKGSWILHMLRHELGDATFTTLMTEWARTHAYGTGTTQELQALAETVSGTSLAVFFDQWLYKAGYPELRVSWGSSATTASVRIDQVQQITAQTPLFDVPLRLRLVTGAGNVDTTVQVDESTESFSIPVPAPATRVILDPDLELLHKGTGLDGVVVGPGPDAGNPAEAAVFTPGGAPVSPVIVPYAVSSWGCNVGAGNLNATPVDEVLTGPGPGPVFGPQVRGFTVSGTAIAKVNFYAYGTLRYGVGPGAGDVDGDGFDEVLTGPGPGAVFGPHVRGFDVDGGAVSAIPGISFYAYSTLRYGANVAAGSIEADPFEEIVTGPGPGAVFGSHVRAFNHDGAGAATPISKVNFFAWSGGTHGATVAAGDLDVDGMAEMLVGAGASPTQTADARGFQYDGVALAPMPAIDLTIFGTLYGLEVASTDEDGDGADGVLAAPGPDSQAPAYVYLGRLDEAGSLQDHMAFITFGSAIRGANVAGGRFQTAGISPVAPPGPSGKPSADGAAVLLRPWLPASFDGRSPHARGGNMAP